MISPAHLWSDYQDDDDRNGDHGSGDDDADDDGGNDDDDGGNGGRDQSQSKTKSAATDQRSGFLSIQKRHFCQTAGADSLWNYNQLWFETKDKKSYRIFLLRARNIVLDS